MDEMGMRGYVAAACMLGGVAFIVVALHTLCKHREDDH
jgi:hypothetical protein